MKERSMKLGKYFELIKPKYVYIQVTPHKSIRNYNSSNIAKAIAHTYRSITKRIRKEQKKLFFETDFKISYVIDIDKDNANFYFLVPKPYVNIILEKIKEIWNKATVNVLDKPIKEISQECEFYQLSYKKEDALSLAVDKKSNEPLNSILSVMDIMKDDDRLTLMYNFMPCSQLGWIDRYEEIMDKIKKNKSVDKSTLSPGHIAKVTITTLLSMIDGVLEVLNDFLGGKVLDEKQSLYSAVMGVLEQQGELSTSTKKKKELTILPTQIAIASESKDKTRKFNNAVTVCQAFRTLDEDNELKYDRCKPFKLEDSNLNTKSSVLSTDEASNLIQVPGRTLLAQHGINHIKTEENKVPNELREGYINLGINKYRGTKINAYIEDHKEIGNLPLMLLGRQGGGKTTFICNYANDCLKRKESLVHLDFIRNNEASKAIEKVVNKEDLIVLDFSTQEGLQALAYNEIKFSPTMSWFEKQQLANKKTQLTIELVNSINESGEPLSPKMERYLCACTDIVYLNEDATFKDVIRCLQDYKYRENIIEKIPDELREEFEEEILTLEELDEWSKPRNDCPAQKIGTRDSKIEGILDRITLLKRDFYLKKMFNKKPNNNINFVDAMEEGKVVLISMPQSKFKNYVKNVITTFIVTKCWLACELRGELSDRSKRTHIIVDEISQTKTAERYMENILTQTRKFGMKFVLAGQYLDQLDKKTIYSLKGAGASFMLLKGTIKEDYEYFKDELDGTYEYEDLKDMEEFSSLNIIQYSKGYSTFITKLPKPIGPHRDGPIFVHKGVLLEIFHFR